MLNPAYCVKDGIDFMENPVSQGDDFYLALEDYKRRIKKKIELLNLVLINLYST